MLRAGLAALFGVSPDRVGRLMFIEFGMGPGLVLKHIATEGGLRPQFALVHSRELCCRESFSFKRVSPFRLQFSRENIGSGIVETLR